MTQPDRPLIFDWGDGSTPTPAAWDEIVTHTYTRPGDYLITVREAVTNEVALAPFSFTAAVDPPVLTVDDATIKTCEVSPYNATLTNGFTDIRQVFSYVTFKATGLTAANTLYRRQTADEAALTTIAMTDLPDGSVRAIFGPFAIERDADTVVGLGIRVPQGLAGPIAGHVDYVTSTVPDPDTGNEVLNVLISDDFTLTVTAGDCTNPPTPGACSITEIAPTPNVTTTTPNPDDPDNPIVTVGPQQITTGQMVVITGTGLGGVTAIALISDQGNGYPCLTVVATEDGTAVSGVIGQLPTLETAHFRAVLVQDQNNTARCQINVDWDYTPGPIPEAGT